MGQQVDMQSLGCKGTILEIDACVQICDPRKGKGINKIDISLRRLGLFSVRQDFFSTFTIVVLHADLFAYCEVGLFQS